MIYLSINYFNNNIYLYNKPFESILCKKNFSYVMNEDIYNKITCVIQDHKSDDVIKLYNDNIIPITFKSGWTNKKDNIKKNILIPPSNLIEPSENTVDLNTINCLCQDSTRINKLPNILFTVRDRLHKFHQWVGYNQVWVSAIDHEEYMVHAYLYYFRTKCILMISAQDKNTDETIDIMSIYQNPNFIHDEFQRINCTEYQPIFNSFNILYKSLNFNSSNITITTQYNE